MLAYKLAFERLLQLVEQQRLVRLGSAEVLLLLCRLHLQICSYLHAEGATLALFHTVQRAETCSHVSPSTHQKQQQHKLQLSVQAHPIASESAA